MVNSTTTLASASDASGLKAEIRRLASLPLDRARTLPGAAYTDPALYEAEMAQIFRKEWICMGREAEIPTSGNYLTIEIDGQPVFAMRQKDGSIRAFANVCAHRFAQLLEGTGTVSGPIVCPYHAWSYNRQGALLGTPHATKPIDPDCPGGTPHLKEFQTAVWQGFLFVTLNPDPAPLAERLSRLDEQLVHFEPEYLGHGTAHEEIWDVNWKVLTENFIESYHLFMVHRTTIEPNCPTSGCTMVDGDDMHAIHFCDFTSTRDHEIPGRPPVPARERAMLYDFVVYPSFMATGRFNNVWWMSLLPMGPGRVKVRWGVAVGPKTPDDDGWEARVKGYDNFVDIANQEDKASLLGVMRGLKSAPQQSGYLTTLEQPLWEFLRYLDRRLNGTNTPPDRSASAYSNRASNVATVGADPS